MKLIKFIQQESQHFGSSVILSGIIVGASNTILLSMINDFISGTSGTGITKTIVFFSVLLLSIFTQRFFQVKIIKLTQNIITNTRLRVINEVRETEALKFKKIGPDKIFASLTYDTVVIGNAASFFVNVCTSMVTVLCCLIYLGYISLISFSFTIVAMILGVLVYMLNDKMIRADMEKANKKQEELFGRINDLLTGFRDIKINREKNDVLFEKYITPICHESEVLNIRSLVRYMNNGLLGEFVMLLMISFMIFVLPKTGVLQNHVIVETIVLILYMLGPVTNIFNIIPVYSGATVAINRISELMTSINSKNKKPSDQFEVKTEFNSIIVDKLCFGYNDKGSDFKVGPVSMRIQEGEIIFISGGNGSGKTTFIKMLTGLYPYNGGSLECDGEKINSENLGAYQSLYTCIYSDAFLFKNVYSIKELDKKKIQEYLCYLKLDHIVTYDNYTFSPSDLSTGQRKRLALIHALIENRPILILDEWAADQDPVFRKYFYHVILPDLKKQGKTVIAITHDDNYYYTADRIIFFEYGLVREISKEKQHNIHF